MTKSAILKFLHYDQGTIALNPYFFNNQKEERGSLILMKLEPGTTLNYQEIENFCFQCPPIENHPALIAMLIFLFDKDNIIYDYSIAATKYKITRNDTLKYEKLIGLKLTRGEEENA